MFRFVVLVSVGALFTTSSASAGFKWLPPVQNKTAPQAVVEPVQPFVSVPVPVAPVMPMALPTATGFPAAPVMAAPLDSGYNNYSVTPPPAVSETHPIPVLPTQVAIPRIPVSHQGLYINPYPLKENGNASVALQGQSVNQAMAEYAGALTPVPLGAGMTTGADPKRMKVAERAVPRAPQLNNSLTPIPGGEPTPLSGIEEAYRNSDLTNRSFSKTYANAVGFGRDLPLELALSQVIPSEFYHRIMGDFDSNLMVSWEGGEPWNVVLNQMLRSHNMTAIIQKNQVIIQPSARL